MLEQRITTATRGSNILDLFITNNEEQFSTIRIEDTMMSDHKLIMIETILDSKSQIFDCVGRCVSFTSQHFFSENTNWKTINDELVEIQWNAFI